MANGHAGTHTLPERLTTARFAIAGVADYDVTMYLDPIPLFMEAIAVAAMFELFITMVVPDNRDRESFMANQDLLDKKRNKISDEGSLRWYKETYVRVYQFPVTYIVVTILQEGLAAADCPSNTVYSIVKVVSSILSTVSTTFAILALYKFCKRFGKILGPRRVIAKFGTLKGLVGLTTTQGLIIGILNKAKVLHGTDRISYYDWAYGFSDMLVTFEMLIAASLFIYAYSWKPYSKKHMAVMPQPSSANGSQEANTFFFFLHGIYFPELFIGMYTAFKYTIELIHGHGKPQTPVGQDWQKEQLRGRKQRGDSYSRLVDETSPRPSTDGNGPIELSPSRHAYSDHPYEPSTESLHPQTAYGSAPGQPPYPYGAARQQREEHGTVAMPVHAQAPMHAPQVTNQPTTYDARPSDLYNSYEPYSRGQ